MPNKPESEKDQKYKPHFLAWAQSYEHEVAEFRELIESRPSDLKELKKEYQLLTGKQYRRLNETYTKA